MTKATGACCGLLVFSAMILRGLLVGNEPQVVITRALIGMAAAIVLGQFVGWIGSVIVRDNLPEEPSVDATDDTIPTVASE
ncbi:MAG TPA: hypothetical protein VMV81_02480 [Phycisphaerae bacterium]|nr:hypothetical protein [Phycisphaerae bacterium]